MIEIGGCNYILLVNEITTSQRRPDWFSADGDAGVEADFDLRIMNDLDGFK